MSSKEKAISGSTRRMPGEIVLARYHDLTMSRNEREGWFYEVSIG